MKVSVITPCLNAARFLPDCVASVRYALEGLDYEHVVADGGSTDGTIEFLRGQAKIDWQSGPDQGMYDALNQAAARASGEVLIHLNADEQLNRVGVQAALALLEQEKLDGVLGPTVMVDSQGAFLQLFKQVVVPRVIDAYWHMPVQTCSFLYRRALWERHPYDASYRLIADHLWVRRQLELGARLGVGREPIGIFFWHGQNLSSTAGRISPEDASADIDIPRDRLQWAKRCYRWRKLLAGGYCRSPIRFEIFRQGQREAMEIRRPCLKIRGNPRDLGQQSGR